jgi:hypothetical protein
LFAGRAVDAGAPRRTCRPWRPELPPRARGSCQPGGPCGSCRPDRAGLAGRPRLAVVAIAQGGQTPSHQDFQIASQRDDLGPQLGDRRPRLRLDQLARAIPLLALLGEHLAESLAPSIN